MGASPSEKNGEAVSLRSAGGSVASGMGALSQSAAAVDKEPQNYLETNSENDLPRARGWWAPTQERSVLK